MATVELQINDSNLHTFKTLIDSLKEGIVESFEIKKNQEYNDENSYPQSVVVKSVEEVRQRVYEAEKRIENGEYLDEEEYELQMDKFFKEELGIDR
jgi:hypothetical protein